MNANKTKRREDGRRAIPSGLLFACISVHSRFQNLCGLRAIRALVVRISRMGKKLFLSVPIRETARRSLCFCRRFFGSESARFQEGEVWWKRRDARTAKAQRDKKLEFLIAGLFRTLIVFVFSLRPLRLCAFALNQNHTRLRTRPLYSLSLLAAAPRWAHPWLELFDFAAIARGEFCGHCLYFSVPEIRGSREFDFGGSNRCLDAWKN